MSEWCGNPGDPGCPNEAYICQECHERLMDHAAAALHEQIAALLDGQEALKRQTIRIRRALGVLEGTGGDTEEHAAVLQAERDKYRHYPFEPICLNCGALTPCMTEADLKPGDPGVPCTFDPTPKQLFEENAALRAKVEELQAGYDKAGDGPHLHLGCQRRERDLEDRVRELEQWVDDLQTGMYINCVYCGYRHGPEETTPVTPAEALRLHVEQCPKHPMSALKSRLSHAEATVERLREALEAELEVHRIQSNPGERLYCRCGLYVEEDGACRRYKVLVAALAASGEGEEAS